MTHHNKNIWLASLIKWLPLAVGIVVLAGLNHITVQQNYRMSANDPQIQVAEDVANAVTAGSALPDNIVPPNPTEDLTGSLAAFIVIYNATGTPIGASVQLDGKMPTPPAGVFDSAKAQGENRFTWQPKENVRIAAVLKPFGGSQPGFVLVGRSLREVEAREQQLIILSGLGVLAALVLAYFTVLLAVWLQKRHLGHEHHEQEHTHHEHTAA